MTPDPLIDALIDSLAGGLRPVRRLPAPGWRTLSWLACVVAFAAALSMFANLPATRARLLALPDLRWAAVAAALTAAAACLAAFQASVPGRSRWWGLLPVPPALLWLGASGWGCLRGWGMPGLEPATFRDSLQCLALIAAFSAPLSLLLVTMLRRACLLWPGRVAALGGLASAAAAAALLTLFHPHDASLVDLLMHIVVVAAIVVVTRRAGLRAARP